MTGANGFLGRALSEELLRRQVAVRCAARRLSGVAGPPARPVGIHGIDANTDWREALDGVQCVIHLAARVHVMKESAVDPLAEFRTVNVAGTQKLVHDAVAAGVQRFVYISSIGVNGQGTREQAFTEADRPAPYDAYTTSKHEAEQMLRQVADRSGIEVVIVRPPLVYGPGNPGNFLRLLALVEKGIPLPLAGVRNSRSMIYLNNLVDALIRCASHPAAAGQTYLVSDGEDLSTPQLITELANLMGKPARLWRLPPGLLRLAAGLLGKSAELEKLIGSLVINSGKIRSELGWSAPCHVNEGFAETVKWFRDRHAGKGVSRHA